MALRFPDKDPNEILDYEVNWTARLEGDVISSSTWIMPVGNSLAKKSDAFSATTTSIWLQDGDVDTDVTLINRVLTVSGRQFDQSINLKIVEK